MEFIKIGNVANVHGIKGELSIYPYTDDINNFCDYKKIYIGENKQEFIVSRSRPNKNMVIMQVKGIASRDEALKYKTLDIYIDKSQLKDLDDDTFYISDLIGLEVIDNVSSDVLGTLTNVFQNPANDIYEVKNGNEVFYIPAIRQVVKKIDIKNKKIYVELMEGLKW